MARATDSISSQAAGKTIPVNVQQQNFKLSMGVVLTDTPVLTYTVEHTFDDIQDPSVTPTWFDTDELTGLTANDEGNIAFPVAAIRLNVTAYTSGTATLTALQA